MASVKLMFNRNKEQDETPSRTLVIRHGAAVIGHPMDIPKLRDPLPRAFLVAKEELSSR